MKSPVAILFDLLGTALGTNTNPLVVSPPYAQRTPFGRARVAEPWTLADLIHTYDISSLDYDTSTATGGTVSHIPAESSIRLTVTGSNGSTAHIRTNTYFRYQAGKAQNWLISLYHADTGQSNQVRQWGYADDNNGLFFQLSGTTLSCVRRTNITGSVVDTVVTQANWNQDKLDGTGTSGVNLDITKGNIFEAHFQWLGVGEVWWFVNGILVHISSHPNTIVGPYMRTAQLPLFVRVNNTGASTGSNVTWICSTVQSDGGQTSPYVCFAAYNNADISTTTTERPLLSIRPKTTFNSITNRAISLPTLLGVSTEGARAGVRLVLNGTLTGASFTSANTNSTVEYDLSATAITGGTTLFRGFLPNANDSLNLYISELFTEFRGLRLSGFANTQDTLTVCGVNEISGTTNMRASLTWKEIR